MLFNDKLMTDSLKEIGLLNFIDENLDLAIQKDQSINDGGDVDSGYFKYLNSHGSEELARGSSNKKYSSQLLK